MTYLETGQPDSLKTPFSAENNPPRRTGVILHRADTVRSQPVDWLWSGWLARAKLHILAGDPGAGKTTLALHMAATASRGGCWPDGSIAEPGDVLFWSGEDDIADTLKPRLARAGADLARVHFIGGMFEGNRKRAFDPARDTEALSHEIAAMQRPVMVVIDPLIAMVTGEDKANSIVRHSLQPLVDLAIERRVAVLGIHHLSKGTKGKKPLERVTGSLAFGALARLVFFAARGEGEAEGERLLVRVKSNLGPDGDGFRYALEQAPLADDPEISASGIVWGEAVQATAADLLAELEPGTAGSPAMSDARRLKQDEALALLAAGKSLRDVERETGIPRATLNRWQKAA
jgi:putative DNA primase/helicase